jgi:surfeit locus 1 family protein
MRRLIFPLLLGLVGCAFLIRLGLWQLDRMGEKRAYLDQIEARIHNPAIVLPDQPNPADHKFQAVHVEGQFTGAFVEVLAGQKDGSPGVRIIEAFRTSDARVILVDRGFLAEEARKTPRHAGAATVTGNLHWPDDTNAYSPPPDARTGLWFGRDVVAMAAKLTTEPTLIVASEPTGDGITPVPVDTSSIPNDHWGYAIQWFLLAATWAVMTGYLIWRIAKRTV